jgi:hypothetical protein
MEAGAMRRISIGLGIAAAWLSVWGARGQDLPVVPAVATKPIPETSAATRDLTRFTAQERHLYLSAKSAMEWLTRVNKTDGRFLPGIQPALRIPLENDNYLHQVGAAGALARASRFFHDERAAAVAKQALLTLLLETSFDPKTQTRFTAAPDAFLNRLASAGLLSAAIHELPNPPADLVQHADQLTNYLRTQLQTDGSFALGADARAEMIQHCTGPALAGLMRSHAHKAADWKIDAVRKGCAHYHVWWRQNKNLPMVPAHTAAYAEAYLATRDKALADAVFEMNDWLCTLQYASVDPRRGHWAGGFQQWHAGKAALVAPDITSAPAAASLADACRVAKHAGDAQRLERYRAALEGCLHFVTTLQYAEANTQHFADWYRNSFLLGGFHLSHQDGTLRVDSTQHALAALVQHLQHVAELP